MSKEIKLDPHRPFKGKQYVKLVFPAEMPLDQKKQAAAHTLNELKKEIPTFQCVGSTVHTSALDATGKIFWTDIELMQSEFMLIFFTK